MPSSTFARYAKVLSLASHEADLINRLTESWKSSCFGPRVWVTIKCGGTAAAVIAAEVALQEDPLEPLLLALSAQAVSSDTSTTSPLEGILENRRPIALGVALSELGTEKTMFPISIAVR